MSNALAAIMLINDALTTINALQPIITLAQQQGRDVTDEELKDAAAKCGLSIQKLDDLIAEAKAKQVIAE
jgi:hypothetical protein